MKGNPTPGNPGRRTKGGRKRCAGRFAVSSANCFKAGQIGPTTFSHTHDARITKADILRIAEAVLLIAAAASADARFAWPYPRKAASPDESGHWIAINGNPWSHDVESELATASLSGGGPDGL
jgi:hypothetical protein